MFGFKTQGQYPFGDLIDTDQELWKMLAWIRTTFNGGEDRRNW